MNNFIPIAKPYIGKEEARAVHDQVESGWISMGRRVEEFEQAAADYLGVNHVIAMSNGTATLHAALLALGVGPGDDVLVPVLSYISSANAVLYCGARPVFVEEDKRTFNIEPAAVEAAITPRTKAVMGVDLKGMSIDYDEMIAVCRRHGVALLADSAESFGATYKGAKVGSQALLHSFSMFANKSITTGEGGLISTNDPELAETCRVVRNQGQSERYVHVMLGHNYRMTDITAAFGLEQLKRVEWFLSQKASIAARYDAAFADNPLIATPYVPAYATRHTWYMYCISVAENVDRDKLLAFMRERGVDHRLSFPPIPLQPYYKNEFGYREGDFPRSEALFNRFLDIPCWVGMNDDEIDRVVSAIKDGVEACSS
ncbi:MAG: DegT/DnrJ/EryC1/StrS aminotransferase family protein [Desulfovibrionaceae bacterium]|nr:DegT/DnrJ/EryC1/StrS aminotransferase family protein [Desulfovibrionaceae bacterium]